MKSLTLNKNSYQILLEQQYEFGLNPVRDGRQVDVSVADLGHGFQTHQRHFAETGGTAREIHASVDAVLQKAVALQSQVFSVDTFYLCTVIVGAAGVLFALFCLKSSPERKAAS